MSLASIVARARSVAGKRPDYVARRALEEGKRELDRWLAPQRQRNLGRRKLLVMSGDPDIDTLWKRLGASPFPAVTKQIKSAALDLAVPGESARILAAAERACSRTVDLLGTGDIQLGAPVRWSRDYRVGIEWPAGFARSLDYVNRDRPSDVKVPWEISRLQWLIPAAQAYLLTGDERYAIAVRDILEEWIGGNPLAWSVNWACAMEAAFRIFTWIYFFRVFAGSAAWSDENFRVRFLSSLYLHGDFTLRHIEKGDINGNHYTADLASLVVAGLFFGAIGDAQQWLDAGWSGLSVELQRQVFADGVDFEASCPYHRLVLELFLWPALFRQAHGLETPAPYQERLRAMARFVAAYVRNDGTTPLWGDADDARTLPFGGQPLSDHRYLIGMVALAFDDAQSAKDFSGPMSELAWIFGPERAQSLAQGERSVPVSGAFPDGGLYIMRDGGTHVFIDCGPVGLAGRGGHGHCDALSFEAWLDGAPLVTDCGSYVYTASFEGRNLYRSTVSHNTPRIDGQEINRFDPDNLWRLGDDARPTCLEWRTTPGEDVFAGAHRGYERLGVAVRRTIRFDKITRSLEISDELSGAGEHAISIPLHLAAGVDAEKTDRGWRLRSSGLIFDLTLLSEGGGWICDVEPYALSPSYGVQIPSQRLVWKRVGPLPVKLNLLIRPAGCEV